MTLPAFAPGPGYDDAGGSMIAALPHNLEAEQALLGSLLFDNAAYERLGDTLMGRHFYEPFHQRLFEAIEDHVRKGLLAEPPTAPPCSRASAASVACSAGPS